MTQDQADRPPTRFQKVASALRGDRQDGPETDPDGVAVTRPDGMSAGGGDHPETMPDMFGTTTRPDPGETGSVEPDAAPDAVPAAAAPAGPGPAEPGTVEPVPAAPVPAAPVPGAPVPGAPVAGAAVPAVPAHFRDLNFGELVQDAAAFRQQWQQIQFKFVDDPRASVTEAADIIAQVTARVEAAIQERQRAIADQQRALRDRWSQGSNADTEKLRETLRQYRDFLDQLLGSR